MSRLRVRPVVEDSVYGQPPAIVLVLLMVVPVLVVGALFFWAAMKDGQEDLALQKRLGIRRRTRLGR